MKKMKIWLIVAAILCAVGLGVMTVSFAAVGFDFQKIDTVDEVEGIYYPDGEFDTILAELDTADIKFLPSEDGCVKVICHERNDVRHSVSVYDGKLVIRFVDERSWFEKITGFYFGREEITVYLPQDLICALVVEGDTGDVTLGKELAFDSAKIETDTGDVTITSVINSRLTVESETGDFILKNTVAPATDIETDTGNVVISNVLFSAALGIFTDTGDIELKESVVSGDMVIETDTGDVEFERIDARNIHITTDTGDVEGSLLSDKIFDVKTKTGDREIPNKEIPLPGGGTGYCIITTNTGNIKIRIVK